MTGAERSQEDVVVRPIDALLAGYVAQQGETLVANSETAWDKHLDDMVETDFAREILPQREDIWQSLCISIESHPGLSARWSSHGGPQVDCAVSWVDLREQGDSTVEVTSSLRVYEFDHTDEIDYALQHFGYRAHFIERRWGDNFLQRRKFPVPTLLGVEAVSRSRKVEFPRDQVSHAVAKLIAMKATVLSGSISVRTLGVDQTPKQLVKGTLRKYGLHRDNGYHQNEDHEIRQSRKDYLIALRQAGEEGSTGEIPRPMDWVIGEEYETFKTIFDTILTSQPVLPEKE